MVFVIAAVAIALLGLRPFGVRPWIWPVAGAALVLALRLDSAAAALTAIEQQWNVLLFILGLMGVSAAAEESGAFAWVTALVLERAGGSRRRLFVLLFLAGAVLTLLFSNDATAIVLTPIVYRAVARRGQDAMPFLLACTFVADTASFGLPFANPANIIVLPHPHLLAYAVHLGPPQLAAIGLNLAIFMLRFKSQLGGRYDVEPAGTPSPAARRVLVALAALSVAYVVAVALDWPLGIVALGGAAVTLTLAGVAPRAAARHVSWSTFALLAGLFALLDAVARAGLVAWALHAVEEVARYGLPALDAVTAIGAAAFSNLLNNLPVAIASSYLVVHAPGLPVAYPAIVGVDLGPNLTTTGSLATILWVTMLRKRGVHVDAYEYFKAGLLVVPAAVAVTVAWLWLVR